MKTETAKSLTSEVDQQRPASDVVRTNRTVLRRVPVARQRRSGQHRALRRIVDNAIGWLVPLLVLSGWQLASSMDWIDARFFPAPTTIFESSQSLIDAGILQEHLRYSIVRLFFGFTLGAAAGLGVGFLLGQSRVLRALFEPILNALYTVPKLALLPLLLLIFGLDERPKISLIAISVFFIVWMTTQAAIQHVDEGYREAARSFGASRRQLLRHVTLPAALPNIFVGLRVAMGIGVLVLVAAEFVQGNTGLGYLIWNSWSLFVARNMYVGIIVVALLGVISMSVIGVVGRLLTPWRRGDR